MGYTKTVQVMRSMGDQTSDETYPVFLLPIVLILNDKFYNEQLYTFILILTLVENRKNINACCVYVMKFFIVNNYLDLIN